MCSSDLEVTFWVAVLVLAIGFSRVFLSLHYTTDVAAGFLVGAFWLLAGFAVSEWTRNRPAPPPCEAKVHSNDAGAR